MVKIYNDVNLPYKVIGKVIDTYIDNGKGDTLYVGKKESLSFKYKAKYYEARITYREHCVEWRFVEYIDII